MAASERAAASYASNVLRRIVITASAIVIAVGAVLAGIRGDPRASYTREEVVRTFAQQGFTLTEPSPVVRDGTSGWTGYAPLSGSAEGAFLLPSAKDFYVFVARSDAFAEEFFEPLARFGGGPRTFDLLRGNVVVSSDASLTDGGLSKDQRRRIRAAMRLLQEPS